MATRKLIPSGSPFEPRIGFSRAVRVGPYVAVSGTAPIAPDGGVAAPGDVYGQTKRCFEIIERAVKSAGLTLQNVIRTHGEIFGAVRPASTFVEVKGLINKGWLVEIEADCIDG
jgi:enamine deaminase RidA (YjgF/YER057c/UK114 family)